VLIVALKSGEVFMIKPWCFTSF